MEPTYFAFRRRLDTPCSSTNKVIGSLGNHQNTVNSPSSCLLWLECLNLQAVASRILRGVWGGLWDCRRDRHPPLFTELTMSIHGIVTYLYLEIYIYTYYVSSLSSLTEISAIYKYIYSELWIVLDYHHHDHHHHHHHHHHWTTLFVVSMSFFLHHQWSLNLLTLHDAMAVPMPHWCSQNEG